MSEILYTFERHEHREVVLTALFHSMRWMPATDVASALAYTNLTFEDIRDALDALVMTGKAEHLTTYFGTHIYRVKLGR